MDDSGRLGDDDVSDIGDSSGVGVCDGDLHLAIAFMCWGWIVVCGLEMMIRGWLE